MLMLLASVAGCAPSVNVQQGPKTSVLPQTQAARPLPPAEPARPAAEASKRAAILLPLSGPQAALGQNLLDAAQLAVLEAGGDGFALLPFDTTGTPGGAAAAARTALRDGAQIVLGPVFTTEVEAVKPVLAAQQVPMLALSNNGALAAPGAYILGLTPQDQATRLEDHARAQNLQRLAALVPEGAFGDAFEAGLSEDVLITRYRSDADLPKALDQIAAHGGVHGVFVAESGSLLQPLLDGLASRKLGSVKLFGPSNWAQFAAAPATLPVGMVGATYVAIDQQASAAFASRYQDSFGKPPAAIAGLAYDATAIAAVLARTGATTLNNSPYSLINLTNPQGFKGTTGLLRFDGDGLSRRGWTLYTITPNGAEVSQPEPSRFGA